MSNRPKSADVFGAAIAEHMEVVRQVEAQQPVLEAIARAMTATLRTGGKILWCGNGGSAGDSQHLAAELVGRYRRERRGMASVALTTDSSALTSIANDYGFEAVFSRQVEALRRQGMATVAFTGAGGGRMVKLADYLFAVASKETARIQEAHILAGHMLCDWIEMDCVSGAEQESAVVLEIAASEQGEGAR
jgi:D-sedoheptulose 7-phosphate isomerase